MLWTGCGAGGGENSTANKPALHKLTVSMLAFDSNESEGTAYIQMRAEQLSEGMEIDVRDIRLVSDDMYTIKKCTAYPRQAIFTSKGQTQNIKIDFSYTKRRSSSRSIQRADSIKPDNLKIAYTKVIVSKESGDKSEPSNVEENIVLDHYRIIEPNAKFMLQASSMESNSSHADLVLDVDAITLTDALKAILKNFRIELSDGYRLIGEPAFSPDALVFEKEDESQPLHLSFDYRKEGNLSDIKASDVTLSYDLQLVAISNLVYEHKNNAQSIGKEGSTVHENRRYRFIIQPAETLIDRPEKEIDIKVQMVEINGTYERPAQGIKIRVAAFTHLKGDVEPYQVITDDKGEAILTYTAPQHIADIQKEVIELVPIGQEDLKSEVTLTFNTHGYRFDSSKNEENISEGGRQIAIDLYLYDEKNRPVEGVEIDAEPIESRYGQLSALKAMTDANGKVRFIYTAPDRITPLANQNLNLAFYLSFDKSVKKTLLVHFTPKKYHFNVPVERHTVHKNGQLLQIVAQLFDESEHPAAGLSIELSEFNRTLGSVDRFEAQTDKNGKVVFTYKAPANLKAVNNQTVLLHMTLKDHPDVVKDVNITLDAPDYHFNVPQNDLTVYGNEQELPISLYLFDDENQPVKGESVKLLEFNSSYGSIDSYEAMTDANGKVLFLYKSPKDIVPLNGKDLNLTFYLPWDTNLKQDITLHFDMTGGRGTYSLECDGNVTVERGGETKDIGLHLYYTDVNGIKHPASKELLKAEYLPAADGMLDRYEVQTDQSGLARLRYSAPERLSERDIALNLYWSKNSAVKTACMIQMRPKLAKFFITPTSLTILQPGETKKIKITAVDQDNVGVSTRLTIENPTDEDGVDYGSFDKTVITTDSSGVAEVTYFAPDELPQGSERNITVWASAIDMNKTLGLKFPRQTGTKKFYDVVVTTDKQYAVDENGKITVTIKEQNGDNVIDDANVFEVNVTSRFPNILTFDGKSKVSYAKSATQQISFETHHLSGAAELDISAKIFDGESNITLQKSATLIIQSGPVASLSLVYVDTLYEKDGYFHDRYALHAVDKYANPAKSITYSSTLINGRRFTYIGATGVIDVDSAGNTIFEDNDAQPFGEVNPNEDRLIILPTTDPLKIDKSYLGDWTIATKDSSAKLTLSEPYYAKREQNLTYVAGSQKRSLADVVCNAHAQALQEKTDENGTAKIEVVYDPMLVGHTYSLAAKTYENVDNNRSGIALKATFRGEGYTSSKKKILEDGGKHDVFITIGINPNGDHLVGVDVTPESVVIDDIRNCWLLPSESNLTTNDNGTFRARIQTNSVQDGSCTIGWINNNSGIYYEY